MTDLYNKAQSATEYIRAAGVAKPAVGIILGSGLGSFASQVNDAMRIPYAEIPHFPRSTVEDTPAISSSAPLPASRSPLCRARPCLRGLSSRRGHLSHPRPWPSRLPRPSSSPTPPAASTPIPSRLARRPLRPHQPHRIQRRPRSQRTAFRRPRRRTAFLRYVSRVFTRLRALAAKRPPARTSNSPKESISPSSALASRRPPSSCLPHPGRRSRRHVHRPRDHRRAPHGPRSPRHLPRHQHGCRCRRCRKESAETIHHEDVMEVGRRAEKQFTSLLTAFISKISLQTE